MIGVIYQQTPLELVKLQGTTILVKREDRCTPPEGPTFSKARGVYAHMKSRREPIIGVLDTLHSKAGWCVSYYGAALEKRVINFWPRFKRDPAEGLPRVQQQRAAELGATMVELKAGMSAVLYNKAKKMLRENFGADAYMMPNALKLPESVEETAAEVLRSALPPLGHIVISISSGTVAAGVLLGLHRARILPHYRVYLHSGYDRPEASVRAYLQERTGLDAYTLEEVRIIREGYSYADKAPVEAFAPFPCNPYYDLKAWHWLSRNVNGPGLNDGRPIVFWNIGS